MKQYLSSTEIARNKRVKELMANRVEKKQQEPQKLTQDEMFDLKGYMSSGYSREEAVALILETRKLLNVKSVEKDVIKNWDTGGFISDTKYKQPIKHRK
ncbi:hypothetical protein UFOVP323_36 [uncultured Caudovirales phage]|uniref:Uncharacterized protein n=1 Tax=uncultured Caudovirales phage TaxID=2100421 RepID=A0A6J5LWN9_9CAUD|nr:hypothetical protein UFOVP323_36 [uncultured Caudovirales phage]